MTGETKGLIAEEVFVFLTSNDDALMNPCCRRCNVGVPLIHHIQKRPKELMNSELSCFRFPKRYRIKEMDITPILHAICAVAVQGLAGLFTGNWAYGAIAGCTFFIAREHTREYRWIEMFGHGERINMPWWGGLIHARGMWQA